MSDGDRRDPERGPGRGPEPSPGQADDSRPVGSPAETAAQDTTAGTSGTDAPALGGEGSSAPRQKRWSSSLIGALVVLALLIAGMAWLAADPDLQARLGLRPEVPPETAVATADLAEPPPDARPGEPLPAPEAEEAIATLRDRLAAMERDLSELRNRLSEATGDPAATASRLSELENRLEQIENRPPPGVDPAAFDQAQTRIEELSGQLDMLTSRLGQIETRIADLERQAGEREPAAEAAQRTAVALALQNLDRALEGSAPYAAELRTLRALLKGEHPTLDILAAHAETGLPSRTALVARFPDTARAALRAEAVPTNGTWWERLAGRVTSLVTIRPTGEAQGMSTEAVLARMEARLDEGDLAAAVAEGEHLRGPAADAAAEWLADARARVAAERALAELRDRLTAAIAAVGS